MSAMNITTAPTPYTSQEVERNGRRVGGTTYMRMAGPDVAACIFAHGMLAVMKHYGIETLSGDDVYAVRAPYGTKAPAGIYGLQVKEAVWNDLFKVETIAAVTLTDSDMENVKAWAAYVLGGGDRAEAEAACKPVPGALAVLVSLLRPKAPKVPAPPVTKVAPPPPKAEAPTQAELLEAAKAAGRAEAEAELAERQRAQAERMRAAKEAKRTGTDG